MKKRVKKDLNKYKLTEIELDRLTFKGVINPVQRAILIEASKLRQPNTYANSRYQIALNQRGTIMLNSVNFNGGESFGKPYHFLAEITHTTTPSVFNYFMRSNRIPTHPFKE